MVCISDGRANVPLSVSNGEPVRVMRSLPLTSICLEGEPGLLAVAGAASLQSSQMWVLKSFLLASVTIFVVQMDPENKPTREELKEEVLKVSKGLVGLGGFNLVSSRTCDMESL